MTYRQHKHKGGIEVVEHFPFKNTFGLRLTSFSLDMIALS